MCTRAARRTRIDASRGTCNDLGEQAASGLSETVEDMVRAKMALEAKQHELGETVTRLQLDFEAAMAAGQVTHAKQEFQSETKVHQLEVEIDKAVRITAALREASTITHEGAERQEFMAMLHRKQL